MKAFYIEKLANAIEQTADLVLITDQDGVIEYVNPAFERLTGYSREEVLGETMRILKPGQQDEAFYKKFWKTMLSSGGFRATVINRKKDGELYFEENMITPLKDEQGNTTNFVSTGRDITAQRQAEAELFQSLSLLKAAIESTADGLMVIANSGEVIINNHKLTLMWNLPPNWNNLLTSQERFSFFAKQVLDPTSFIKRTQELIENPQLESYDLITLKNGKIFERYTTPYRVGKEIVGRVWSFRDMTEQKRAEQALHRYAERLRALHEIDQAILAAQSSQAIAEAALSYIGRLAPCQQASVIEFDPEAQAAKTLATWHSRTFSPAASPPPAEQADVTIPLVVQGERIGTLNLGPGDFTTDHLNIAKEVAASLAVGIKQARLYEQIQQDAKTKASLLSEVNHRVKNNLSAIIGLLYAERHRPGAENLAAYQAIMTNLSSRIQGMATVHNLLSISQWRPLHLSELTEQVIEVALQAITSDKQATLMVSPSPVQVTSKQANSLALIINELATNSIKYALLNQRRVQIVVQITQEQELIRFTYQDNGPGYPESVLTKNQYNVGLYLIQTIAEGDLHGHLHLHNDGGAAATIRFKMAGQEQ
jgi:PAS domain S-box-containing protein